MNIEEFLKSDIIKFPSDQPEKMTYLETIHDRFAAYQDAIANLDPHPTWSHIKSLSGKINGLCKKLEESVKSHISGKTHESYENFKKGISIIDQELRLWYSKEIDSNYTKLTELYRMRVDDKILSDKKEIFHIPFELRHLVKTQRYSIPGLPCLYFGSSSYISWKEMGEPPLNTVHISRFEPSEPIKILNLAIDHNAIIDLFTTPKEKHNNLRLIDIKQDYSDNPLIKQIISWFALFPLLVATSIRRKHPEAFFCDEYILPQHLMQFILNDKDHDIDGIRYISTKFRNDIKDSFTKAHCWAFPVKTSKDKGHCPELKKIFKNTEIQSWKFPEKLIYENIDDAKITSEHLPGYDIPYNKTIWGKSEAALLKLPATSI